MPTLKERIIWDVFAWVYDMAASRGIPYLQLVEKVSSIVSSHCTKSDGNKTIVDACCGTGNFSVAFKQSIATAEIIGIDFSVAMLKRARIKNKQIVFLNEDILLALKKVKQNSVNVVTMINGFYPLQDKAGVLNEINRILRKDGIFVISDPREGARLSGLVQGHISAGGWRGWIHLPFFIGGLVISALLQYKVSYAFQSPDDVIKSLEAQGFEISLQQAAYASQNYLLVASKMARGDT